MLDTQKLLEFSELGVYCEIDNFGNEGSHDQINEGLDIPSDTQRIDQIKALVAEGKEDRILMSHDIHTKHRLVKDILYVSLINFIFLPALAK